ncbi:MAG TPA: DUF1206 domain-containing protein [Solirubrobacteraceae bacterium]|nr:DUF1206 domain-containing protein [Solirubrobacteraceae bacterium]
MSGEGEQESYGRAQRGGDAVLRRRELEWLARAGLVARGVVYATIGILAVKLAVGSGGHATNQTGALKTIAHQPLGEALLIATALGLAGYSLWRLTRAIVGHGTEEKDSALDRVAGLASGIAYGGLCLTAVKILTGASTKGATNNPKGSTGDVLSWTLGPELVGVAGLILIGVGLYQGYKGLSREFMKTSHTEQMSPAVTRAFTALGVFGHLARMVVFALAGYGLVKAALDHNKRNAIGLDGALNKLAHASYGPLLLGLVAVGLIGFALYSIADARYRRV